MKFSVILWPRSIIYGDRVNSFARLKSTPESDAGIWRNSPLHYACSSGSVELVRQLIARGDNPSVLNHESETPLYFAFRSIPENGPRSLEIINLLLTAGCKPNGRNLNLEMPLHLVRALEEQCSDNYVNSSLLVQVTNLLLAFGAEKLRPRLPHEW